MPESIEHNASIIGRIFEPYYKSLMVKIHITEENQYALIEQSITLIEQSVLLECIDLFCHMHFEEQECASATYYVPITAHLLGIEV